MKKRLLYILSFLVLQIVSCQNKIEDHSKTTEEYYFLGISNLNSEWNIKELEKAHSILKKLKKEDNLSLPRKKSIKSSDFFNKMIAQIPDFKEYHYTNNKDFSLKVSLIEKHALVLLNIYGKNDFEEEYYSEECVEIESAILISSTNSALIYFNNLEKTSIEINRMAKHLTDIYVPLLHSCKDYKKYKKKDKIKFSLVFSKNIVKIWDKLEAKHKTEIISDLEKISTENRISELRKNYITLLKKLK
jgi:hypothetical protein